MLRTSAMSRQHQISRCNLKEPSGWLLVKSFCSLATVLLHNVFELDREEYDYLYYNRTFVGSFDTTKQRCNIKRCKSNNQEKWTRRGCYLLPTILIAREKFPWAKWICAKFIHTSGIWTKMLPLAASWTYKTRK